MSETVRGMPEAYQHWKPKPTPQTMAEIDRSAAFHQELHESLEKFFEKQTVKEREAVKVPWWVLLVALLGTIGSRDKRGYHE